MIYGWVSDYFKFFNSLQTVFNRSFQATPCAVILLHVRFLSFEELKTKKMNTEIIHLSKEMAEFSYNFPSDILATWIMSGA